MRRILTKISSLSRCVFHTGTRPFERISDSDKISELIRNKIESTAPCMIARYGATELMCMINYLGVKNGRPNLLRYLLGLEHDWWWNPKNLKQIEQWSGFFPATEQNLMRFGKLMEDASDKVDIFASWLNDESYFSNHLTQAIKIQGLFLDPFWAKVPWTKALENKKVLVVHPFASLIEWQYKKYRRMFFHNTDILPDFTLNTVKAVQSLGGESNGFNSWFDALEWMKMEMDKIDYDVVLLGCGAYGFPLAAYAKEKGKKAIHVGGSLQLLFGIKGRRWENPHYGEKELGYTNAYPSLFNEYWVYPNKQDRPNNADKVENACYW